MSITSQCHSVMHNHLHNDNGSTNIGRQPPGGFWRHCVVCEEKVPKCTSSSNFSLKAIGLLFKVQGRNVHSALFTAMCRSSRLRNRTTPGASAPSQTTRAGLAVTQHSNNEGCKRHDRRLQSLYMISMETTTHWLVAIHLALQTWTLSCSTIRVTRSLFFQSGMK